jgi:hypothetical protein
VTAPKPPASIAQALCDIQNLCDVQHLHDERGFRTLEPSEFAEEAQAVWDALLAEGWIAPWTSPQFARVLVIPLETS